ncbi:MAG: preprotein translocase subunit YajC [Candidatus Glassbacteria bacterium]
MNAMFPDFPTWMAIAGGQGSAGGGFVSILPILAMVAIIYFLLIRPQQKEQARHRKMVDSLRQGDEVVTVGGVYGKIIAIQGDRLKLKVDEKTNLTVEKNKISRLSGKGTQK